MKQGKATGQDNRRERLYEALGDKGIYKMTTSLDEIYDTRKYIVMAVLKKPVKYI